MVKTIEDLINSPQHYTHAKVECSDLIEQLEFLPGFCIGNALKYIYRHEEKGDPINDLKKAVWYLRRYIKFLEEE